MTALKKVQDEKEYIFTMKDNPEKIVVVATDFETALKQILKREKFVGDTFDWKESNIENLRIKMKPKK